MTGTSFAAADVGDYKKLTEKELVASLKAVKKDYKKLSEEQLVASLVQKKKAYVVHRSCERYDKERAVNLAVIEAKKAVEVDTRLRRGNLQYKSGLLHILTT